MIAFAEQRGDTVFVYDEKGNLLCMPSGKLVGYTSTTVSVKIGITVFVLDERGNTKYMK